MGCSANPCNDITVCFCNFTRKAAVCTIKIQNDFLVIYKSLFIPSHWSICLNGKCLVCIFSRWCLDARQCACCCLSAFRCFWLILYDGITALNGNDSVGVIPFDVQMQSICQCPDRQHGSVIDDGRRNIHGEFLSVFIPCFAVYGKNNDVTAPHDINLFCSFVPIDFTPQLLGNLPHRKHGSAVNDDRRHVLGNHCFSVDLYFHFLCRIGMVFAVIK